jgi:hypothetical protein
MTAKEQRGKVLLLIHSKFFQETELPLARKHTCWIWHRVGDLEVVVFSPDIVTEAEEKVKQIQALRR